MTTRVLVVNHGPLPVDVHTFNPLVEGGARQAAGSLHPQTQREFYVYDSQSIEVTERKEPLV